VTLLRKFKTLANDKIPLPPALFGAARKNSQGLNMNIQQSFAELELAYQPHLKRQWQAAPVINGQSLPGAAQEVRCPYELNKLVGTAQYASAAQAAQAAGCVPHLVRSGRAAALGDEEVAAMLAQVPGSQVHADLAAFAASLLGSAVGAESMPGVLT
jgi:delta 1-pyrroline-5-carboxylate dehydrogenase